MQDDQTTMFLILLCPDFSNSLVIILLCLIIQWIRKEHSKRNEHSGCAHKINGSHRLYLCCQWQYGTIKYLSSSSLFSSTMVDRHSSPGQSSPSFYPILRSLKVKVAPMLWSKSQRSEFQTLSYLCSFAVLHVTNTSSMRQHGSLHYGDEGGGKLYQITCD